MRLALRFAKSRLIAAVTAVVLVNCQLGGRVAGCARRVGSPRPWQGRGEGEGLFRQIREHVVAETPHLNPLPLDKGRGENN